VSVVNGATYTQKEDDVESNGGFLENVAEIIVLFFCGVQLVLRSGVLKKRNEKTPLVVYRQHDYGRGYFCVPKHPDPILDCCCLCYIAVTR